MDAFATDLLFELVFFAAFVAGFELALCDVVAFCVEPLGVLFPAVAVVARPSTNTATNARIRASALDLARASVREANESIIAAFCLAAYRPVSSATLELLKVGVALTLIACGAAPQMTVSSPARGHVHGSLRGTYHDDAGYTKMTALARAEVAVYRSNFGVPIPPVIVQTRTDADGNYEIDVAPGSYVVTWSYFGAEQASRVDVRALHTTIMRGETDVDGLGEFWACRPTGAFCDRLTNRPRWD